MEIDPIKSKLFSGLISDLSNLTQNKIILYVEDKYNRYVNEYLTKNYDRICEVMNRSGNEFIYLPKLMENPKVLEGIGYYLPYLEEIDKPAVIQDVYQSIIYSYQIDTFPGSFVRFSKDGRTAEYWYPVNEKILYFDQLLNLPAHAINNRFQETQNIFRTKNDKLFNLKPEVDAVIDFSKIEISEAKFDLIQPEFEIIETVDLDPEIYILMHEIAEKIQRLTTIGGLPFFVNLIKNQLKIEPTLSTLRIDSEYRIWLDNYNKEIKLQPLQKIIYLLYLNHPEGIAFQELSDYRKELIQLYKSISQRENVDLMIENINRLINPFDNSLNEKISRIRLAFLNELDEHLALPYLITGERGEKRKVLLDRSLIIREMYNDK